MATASGRMLLSHNFNISEQILPALNRADFAQIFIQRLASQPGILACQLIDNPHWVVEVIFDPEMRSPLEVGQLCLNALAAVRLPGAAPPKPHFLALGGIKSTPGAGTSPSSLQQGEWGVDMVETPSVESFLKDIGWEASIANRDPGSIFKVEIRSESRACP